MRPLQISFRRDGLSRCVFSVLSVLLAFPHLGAAADDFSLCPTPVPTLEALQEPQLVGHIQEHIPSLTRRQGQTIVPLGLDADTPLRYNGQPGTTIYYSFQVAPTSTEQAQPQEAHPGMLKRSDTANTSPAAEDDLEEFKANDAARDKRQNANTVYVSINACRNPTFTYDSDNEAPPQMTMLVSAVTPDQEIGSSLPNPQTITLAQGQAQTTVSASSGAVMIGVFPPNVEIHNETAWVYDVAASLTMPYHNVESNVGLSLKLIDSDTSAGLLITEQLQGWSDNQTNQTFGSLDHGPPLNVFASNFNFSGLNGLQNSYCAQSEMAQVQGNNKASLSNGVEMGVITAKPNDDLEQQIYLPGLNASSVYLGQLATLNASAYGDGSVVGGGGTLYPVMNFTTKTDPNCGLVFNLSFCSDVNYAVPANPNLHSRQNLSALYDNSTYEIYQNFSYSLQQINCNTTPTAQYSLAVTCDDCASAYKTWLCAVSIPKCADFSKHYNSSASYVEPGSSPEFPENPVPSDEAPPPNLAPDWSWLMPRNLAQAPIAGVNEPLVTNTSQLSWLATNSSRNNATIAGLIQPGPYLEILPCEDLCFDLVRMCPAALQFSCPRPNSVLLRASYGQRGVAPGSGAYTCNAPGAVYFKNEASVAFSRPSTLATCVATGIMIITLFW